MKKLDPRSIQCVFVRYAQSTNKVWRFWDPSTNKLIYFKHAVFSEFERFSSLGVPSYKADEVIFYPNPSKEEPQLVRKERPVVPVQRVMTPTDLKIVDLLQDSGDETDQEDQEELSEINHIPGKFVRTPDLS